MSKVVKRTFRKSLKKKHHSTVIVIERTIAPEEILFPEKVKRANEVLGKVKWNTPSFGPDANK